MAEQTINCQIRTTEETKKRFAAAAEESGITQGALLASMLDTLDVDKFGASHKSYAATLEAFDGKFRELRDLYKGLIITADNAIDAGVKSADEAHTAAEQKLTDALAKIEVMKLDLEHAELVVADRDRLKADLAKTEDELARRTARVDELEAERGAVKEAEAQAESDRAAAAEAKTAKVKAEARADAAEAELEKVKAAAENELATLKAKAEADSALAAEKLAAAVARRDDLAAEAESLRVTQTADRNALDALRAELSSAKADLAAARATAEALQGQIAFAQQLALAKPESQKAADQQENVHYPIEFPED